jgi:hypothetical protein
MKAKQADILGIVSAGLCIIHCLLIPFLIVYGVSTENFFSSWEYLDWGFISLSGLAVILATRHEKNQLFTWLMWSSLLIFTFALLLHEHWPPALYLSVVSSLGLAILHLLHFRNKEHKLFSTA